MKNVKTQIIMQATAKLQDEIEKELEDKDPSLEEAESALRDNKNENETA